MQTYFLHVKQLFFLPLLTNEAVPCLPQILASNETLFSLVWFKTLLFPWSGQTLSFQSHVFPLAGSFVKEVETLFPHSQLRTQTGTGVAQVVKHQEALDSFSSTAYQTWGVMPVIPALWRLGSSRSSSVTQQVQGLSGLHETNSK